MEVKPFTCVYSERCSYAYLVKWTKMIMINWDDAVFETITTYSS